MEYNIDDIDFNFDQAWSYLTNAHATVSAKIDNGDADKVITLLTKEEITQLVVELHFATEYLSLVGKKLYQLNLIPDDDGTYLTAKQE
ncbi:MAG: hypothetical protein AB1631_10230 [Acidobacteriota bacterium]